MKHLGKNLVIALCLLAAGFFAAWLRFRPHLDVAGRFTDGTREYGALHEAPVRYAIWDAPEPLPGEVNSAAHEGRPTQSHDGRWLAFATGARGLNAELWLAELVDGRATRARPLDELNSAHDELAPAFGAGWLYFASDRPGGAGGLDIWRCSFDDGRCGPPELVGGGINTRFDETDPAPLPNGRALAFASNRDAPRGRGHDLYFAQPDALGQFIVEPIGALNTNFDEREPAFTADGRTLVFASDRGASDGARSFDLYRSLWDRGAWLPPEPLVGLDGPGSRRGPWPSLDGFTLLYSVEAEDGSSDIHRARSLELFRQPARPIGWLDLALLLALLLLALLALLAKRWERLDVLYKCFLVSFLLHLALLWWFRHVHPESALEELQRGEQSFQVRLARDPSGPPAGAREHGGVLELLPERAGAAPATIARAQLERPLEARAAAAAVELVRAEPAPAPTPYPSASAARASSVDHPALALRAQLEPPQRHEGAAPTLALMVPSTLRATGSTGSTGSTRRTEELPGPAHARPLSSADAQASGAQLRPSALARAGAHDAALPTRAPLAAGPAPISVAGPQTPLFEAGPPRQTLERGSGAAAPLALAARAFDPGTARERVEAPQRAELQARSSALEGVATAPPSGLARVAERSDAGGPAPAPAELGPRSIGALSGLTLAGPRVEGESPATAPSVAEGEPAASARAHDDWIAMAATPLRRERTETSNAPERWRGDARAQERPLAPGFRALDTAARAADEWPRTAPDPFEHTPYRTRFGLAKERALAEHGGTSATEAAVARGLDYLASIQQRAGHWGEVGERDEKYGHVLIGKTGLCLLAFLGAGHTQDSASEHSRVVRLALDFLLGVQDEESGHFAYCSSYGHGIATYALAECYALTRDQRLRAPLERAVAQILRHQKRGQRDGRLDGGWGYFYPDAGDHRGDAWPRVSVTAWQVMALESARLGGLEVPARAFDDARRFLAASWDAERGYFRYSHQPARLNSAYPTLPGSTPAALFALSLLGEDLAEPRYEPALHYVASRAPDGYRYTNEREFVARARGNLYFWYYATLALFRRGDAPWRAWNERMKETLLPAQQEDGSWRPISVYSRYAAEHAGDRSYTTALCVLTLEIYYRYFTPLLMVSDSAEAPR